MKFVKMTVAGGLAAAAMLALAGPSAASGGGGTRLYCSANGSTDISMSAAFETRKSGSSTRTKFKAEFEAAPRLGFVAGQSLGLAVAGTSVATLKLVRALNGDIVTEVEYSTKLSQEGHEKPFPANFPAVKSGTVVTFTKSGARVLSCTLT